MVDVNYDKKKMKKNMYIYIYVFNAFGQRRREEANVVVVKNSEAYT